MLLNVRIRVINPVTKLVIPAAAERRARIQKRPFDYWIPATGSSPAQAPREWRKDEYQMVYLIAQVNNIKMKDYKLIRRNLPALFQVQQGKWVTLFIPSN